MQQRIATTARLDEAVSRAAHVQENVLENVGAKKEVFAALDACAPKDAVLPPAAGGRGRRRLKPGAVRSYDDQTSTEPPSARRRSHALPPRSEDRDIAQVRSKHDALVDAIARRDPNAAPGHLEMVAARIATARPNFNL